MNTPTNKPILILYTGGTIGMTLGPQGWQPAPGFDAQIRAAQEERKQQERGQEQQEQGRAAVPPWTYATIDPPIDSSNMTQQHWLAMRDRIVNAVERGDCRAVLILHGTDTLAYTAAALRFLLLGLPAPVCVTGAMQPARQPDTDAWNNLFGALAWLDADAPCGVHIFFDGKPLPGARTTKRFSHRRDAFAVLRATDDRADASPAQVDACLDYRVVRKPVRLAVLPMVPGMDAAALDAVLQTGVAGLILELYGSGVGPTHDVRFLDALRRAHERGVILVGISQCPGGSVDGGQYAAASRLFQTGVLPGGAMTREAAMGKLFGLLGAGLSAEAVRQWWPQDLCGEWRQ